MSDCRETNGNLCNVVIMTGTAFSKASASWREFSHTFCTTPLLVLELVDRVLQLRVQNDAIRHDDHAVEKAFILRIVQ